MIFDMIEEELRKYVGGKYSSRELKIAINFYRRGLTDKKPTDDEMLRALRMEYEKGRADVIDKAYKYINYQLNLPNDFEQHFRKAMEK